ncbi:hypothetical protein [Paenibacillus pabuli]|uniref:hypothetical protein n=1 Tax=Paenibacillus pabuli TaxID=1472 RepID=UPI0007852DE6|nr:hypothetical protein [Paenibacillus pabuli]MEC0123402.1 hypothetical protein [Paenibacillus pabuli]
MTIETDAISAAVKGTFQPLGAGSPMLVHDVRMDQYEFDENGNLKGPLIDWRTGETVDISPRWTAHQEALAQAAWEMRLSLSGFSNDVQVSIQMFQTHIATSESQSFTPIAYNATATLQGINRWYQESIYIERLNRRNKKWAARCSLLWRGISKVN